MDFNKVRQLLHEDIERRKARKDLFPYGNSIKFIVYLGLENLGTVSEPGVIVTHGILTEKLRVPDDLQVTHAGVHSSEAPSLIGTSMYAWCEVGVKDASLSDEELDKLNHAWQRENFYKSEELDEDTPE